MGADFKCKVFSKFSPKFTQKDIFRIKFKDFFILDESLKFHKILSGDFIYDNSFLKLPYKTTQIKHFSTKYKEFLFLLQNLSFQKFESIDSK